MRFHSETPFSNLLFNHVTKCTDKREEIVLWLVLLIMLLSSDDDTISKATLKVTWSGFYWRVYREEVYNEFHRLTPGFLYLQHEIFLLQNNNKTQCSERLQGEDPLALFRPATLYYLRTSILP